MSSGTQVNVSLLEIGSEFAGYRVEAALGRQSGIGRVYEAARIASGERVALKVFMTRAMGSAEVRAHFAQTLETQAGLSHPNVVSLEEWGTEPSPYMVMTLVRGTTFAELLAEGTLSDRRALDILAAAAEGLDAGRNHGLVYRRLQPSGILVADDGSVRLGDFGAARGARGPELIRTSRLGRYAGYISPEELRDEQVTAASGVYSLGAIVREALAGRPPPASQQEVATLQGHLERPELPRRLGQAVQRALSADPGLRQETAGELMQTVIGAYPDELADAETPTAEPPTRQGRSGRAALAALAVGAAAGAAALGTVAAGGEQPAPGPVAAKRLSTPELTLRHPADWRVSRQAPRIAGLALADPVAVALPSGRGELVAGRVASGSLPARDAGLVDFGAVVARSYTALREEGTTRPVVAYALPGADGQVIAACVGSPSGAFGGRCRRVASTVRARREGVALAAASPTYARAMSGLVRRLDRVRIKGRRRLARARTPAGQRRLTARLSRDYAALGAALERVRVPAPARASHREGAGQLRRASRGFRDMSRAARARAPGRWTSARRGVRSAEGRLQGALRSLRRLGYQVR